MLMYSRSQPCTVSDKLAPACSIVGSYIYPGDETHIYLCMSVHTHTSLHARACRGVEGWRGQLLAGEVQRRGEPTVTQFTVIPPSATGPQSLSCHHCSSMSILDHEAHSRRGWLALQAGHPQTQGPTRVHCKMRDTILQEFSVSKIHIRMSRKGKPMHGGWEYKTGQAPRKQVAAPEPVQYESHQTSNSSLRVYPKEWKAGYLSKYRYRNVQSSKAYNSQRWEQVLGGFKQALGPLGPEIGKLAAYFRPLDDFLSTPMSRKVKR